MRQLDTLLIKRIEAAKKHETNIFMGIFIGIGVAFYLLTALYHSMKRAITNIFAGTQRYSLGDWREEVTISSADEFSDIAASLNTVRGKIRPIISRILNSAEQVATATEELTASAEQSAQAANQVAISITEVANGTQEQLAAASDTSLVVQQISDRIQHLASNTNEVAEQSAKTSEKAKQLKKL